MPIYEFECHECGQRFEVLTEAGTGSARCPSCGAADAERRFSTFGLSHGMTPGQQRRLEDRRGINRDGARQRFKADLDKRRGRRAGPGS